MAESQSRGKSYDDILEEALKAREQFLKEHPHLLPFQNEIDRILGKTVGFERRMSVIAFMIEKKLYELRDSIAVLGSYTVKVRGFLNKAQVENVKVPDYSTSSNGSLN